MKTKQIYISDENFDKLKDINASALVNDMLTQHFSTSDVKAMTPEERAREIALLEIKIDTKKRIEEIQK